MPTIEFSFERIVFGSEYWSTPGAIDEIEIYCDLLDNLQERIDSLETRGKGEEATLIDVQAVISSYAFEIAMKSFWALNNSNKKVPKEHNLLKIFDELAEETVKSFNRLGLTRGILEYSPEPFKSNRYSMELIEKRFLIPPARLLRSLIKLLGDKLDESREMLFKPLKTSTD